MSDIDPEIAIETLDKIDMRIRNGHDPSEILESLNVTQELLDDWLDRYCAPPDFSDIIRGSGLLNAVTPLFEESQDGQLEQTASGVLVGIGDAVFCLTATHCYAPSAKKPLYLPGADGIIPMNGRYFIDPHRMVGTTRDTVDSGFCRLDPDIAELATQRFPPISIDRFLFTDHWEHGDLYTFCGYPWRKTKKTGKTHLSDFVSFTGHSYPESFHDGNNLDTHVNIAIRLRRKKTYSSRHQSYQTAPLPHGISGGPIFAWAPYMEDRCDPDNLMLGGIGHTFWEKKNCLVGTRMIPIAMAIMISEPDLRPNFPQILQEILN